MVNIKITLVYLDVWTIKFGPGRVADGFIPTAVFTSVRAECEWAKYIDPVIFRILDTKNIISAHVARTPGVGHYDIRIVT